VDPEIAEIHHRVAEIEKDPDMVKFLLGLDRRAMELLRTSVPADCRGTVGSLITAMQADARGASRELAVMVEVQGGTVPGRPHQSLASGGVTAGSGTMSDQEEGELQGEVAIEAEVPTQGGVGKHARRAARAARKRAEVLECAQEEVVYREEEAGAEKWLPAKGHLPAGQEQHTPEVQVPRGDCTVCGMWSSWHVCSGVSDKETVIPRIDSSYLRKMESAEEAKEAVTEVTVEGNWASQTVRGVWASRGVCG
jgi:hypothetical protein